MARDVAPLWERFNLRYFARRPADRRWKLILASVAPLTAAIWVGWSAAGGRRELYSSGPMSIGHAQLAKRCSACHTQPFTRFAFVSDEHRAMSMNEACLTCHAGAIAHDATTRAALHQAPNPIGGSAASAEPARRSARTTASSESTLACSSCHREHEGARRLIDMDDHTCIRCHADLTRLAGLTSTHVDPTIARFGPDTASSAAGHPEFRLLATDSPLDPGRLAFNHKRHLQPEAFGEQGLLGPESQRVFLNCDDCHRAGLSAAPWRFARLETHQDPRVAAGDAESQLDDRYMGSIRYGLHCAACHELRVPGRSDELPGDGRTTTGCVPHDTPAAIRTFLRGQLFRFITDSARSETPIDQPERTPWRPRPNVSKEERRKESLAWAEEELSRIEEVLYTRPGQQCLKCHSVESPAAAAGGAPRIVPAGIPQRWLPHASFSHARHQSVVDPRTAAPQRDARSLTDQTCLLCHSAAAASEPSSDVLIPGIASCRQCHAPATSSDPAAAAGVSDRCVLCHTFHRAPLPGSTSAASVATMSESASTDGRPDIPSRSGIRSEPQ
jgi:hypothetical protein